MPKVYIINKSIHDFSKAEEFGTLHYLSEKAMNRYATNNIYRKFFPPLNQSSPMDYILVTSLNTMNIIACVIFVLKHKKLNLLIHKPKTNTYVERKLNLT